MSTEPTFKTRQKLAFTYLRERACRSHLEGDGLRVNSLCAVASAQAEQLATAGKLQVTLADLRWCYVFPLYWLINSYALRTVQRSLEAIHKAGMAEDWLY